MKKIITIMVLTTATAILTTSCGGSKHEKTINNLKAAIEGETGASAKYKAFSIRAEEEGFHNISRMFAAASEAETIHVRTHNSVLEKLGQPTHHPTPETPVVSTTLENLMAAIEGETYEFEVMYPGFIADAHAENREEAVRTFEWAKGAEMTHARFYSKALEILKATGSDATISSAWFVCPKCGDLFDSAEDLNRCPLCGVNPSMFLKF